MINPSNEQRRARMVAQQIAARGVRSPAILRAMSTVKREGYVPSYLGEFAYDDTPLPIEEEQTISQPYIVSYMVDALRLGPEDKVLEVGTGSGYAAAVLGELAGEVYTIERHKKLAETAEKRLQADGYRNVHVRHGDGTLGWPEQAPFNAIVVAAGGPEVPPSLLAQLTIGGRLVIPVGEDVGVQKLLRVTRTSEHNFEEEELADVRFVPLVGTEAWSADSPQRRGRRAPQTTDLARLVADSAESFDPSRKVNFDALLERIGSARVVLLGEASHGTSEFYTWRAEITRQLIEKRGFRIVAAEADWPDASRIDDYVRRRKAQPAEWQAFARFPTWMWRNDEVKTFVDWLHDFNQGRVAGDEVRFAGLDLYGLYNSIAAVIELLDATDPQSAQIARQRYGCLTPWQHDPVEYGRAALSDGFRSCERPVLEMLERMMAQRVSQSVKDGDTLFNAQQNARLVADAEVYYRNLYYGGNSSWNFRDRHMFRTLTRLLDLHGPHSKAVVWAHNSHLGDASATEMAARGELNLGQLCREQFAEAVYSVGFGTYEGQVAAASHWGGPMEIKEVLPSRTDSYEYVCHESGVGSFLLPLRHPREPRLRKALLEPKLQRAIGVIYRPETERASHYFQAVLPRQFDEYLWLERTHAVRPLETSQLEGLPETYPFGL